MSGTLVDSNVLIDVLGDSTQWAARSEKAIRAAGADGPLVINEVIYAEVSVRYADTDELDVDLPIDYFQREHTPLPAAFLAGKAFLAYRQKGGPRLSTLPDFFIGAHAAITGLRLLTRDPRRYRSYFPTVELITPE